MVLSVDKSQLLIYNEEQLPGSLELIYIASSTENER